MYKIISFFLFLSFLTLSLEASVYKGHRLFKVKCISCHGQALHFVIDKTSYEWEQMLSHNGKAIIEAHYNKEEAAESLEFIDSDRFVKNLHHFRDFFMEYAKDSGNIPACD